MKKILHNMDLLERMIEGEAVSYNINDMIETIETIIDDLNKIIKDMDIKYNHVNIGKNYSVEYVRLIHSILSLIIDYRIKKQIYDWYLKGYDKNKLAEMFNVTWYDIDNVIMDLGTEIEHVSQSMLLNSNIADDYQKRFK